MSETSVSLIGLLQYLHSPLFGTGVELHDDVIEHCKSSIAKWKTNAVEEQADVSTIHFMDITPNIQLVKGNGLNVIKDKGESVVGFDRIYIGAAVDKEDFKNIVKLLSPGGILVGPGKSFALLHTELADMNSRSSIPSCD
jgi:protein-L-isoaspartate O-methyltransferase